MHCNAVDDEDHDDDGDGDDDVADGSHCGGNKNRGQRAAGALRSVSAMQLIEHTDAICHKHHIRQLGVQESPSN